MDQLQALQAEMEKVCTEQLKGWEKRLRYLELSYSYLQEPGEVRSHAQFCYYMMTGK